MSKHLIKMTDFDERTINALRAKVVEYAPVVERDTGLPLLSGKIITQLFFECSLTQYLSTIAGQRLGAMVIDPNISDLSLKKGESLIDTLQTFIAMGTRLFVIHCDAPSLWQPLIFDNIVDRIGAAAMIINNRAADALIDFHAYDGEDIAWRMAIFDYLMHP